MMKMKPLSTLQRYQEGHSRSEQSEVFKLQRHGQAAA